MEREFAISDIPLLNRMRLSMSDVLCKIICMVKTSPNAEPHKQQSQILVPLPHPGVTIVDGMKVFGDYDAPHGHMHLKFENVRVPKENILLGEGRGFEISQLRLGPGRIHHCMRSLGAAERALDLMVRRGLSREAFGQPLTKLGGNREKISRARIEIEAMRLMVLKAAKAMDVLGNKEARVWISMVKAMVPEKVCKIIDGAIDQALRREGRSALWTRAHRRFLPPLYRPGSRCRGYAVLYRRWRSGRHRLSRPWTHAGLWHGP